MKSEKKASKMLGAVMIITAVLLGFFLMVSKTSVTVPPAAHASDRFLTNLVSADAGALTRTICPGVDTTVDVLCSARFCYKVAGIAGSTPTSSPVNASCFGNTDFLYDGGNPTTKFGEGIRGAGPPAQIQMGNLACIAFSSPDNAFDAGTLGCSLWVVKTNNGGQ